MLNRIIFIVLMVSFAAAPCFAEIAVLPYRVINPQDEFNEATGKEFSKMIGVGALVMKRGVVLTSPRDIEIDFAKFNIDPQDTVSAEELQMIGSSRKIDFFIIGSIRKTREGFQTESFLYSVKDKRKINRSHAKAGNLHALAWIEIKELLISFRDKKEKGTHQELDVLFLVDSSYANYNDSKKIKNGVVQFLRKKIDTDRIDTRAYIIPNSSKSGYDRLIQGHNAIDAIEKKLESLSFQGQSDRENFERSFAYGVNNIRWRTNSQKKIIIITNSVIGKGGGNERHALKARKLGIKIYAISLGKMSGDDNSMLKRMCEMTGGLHYAVAYHQTVFNAEGEKIELYLFNGRLFAAHYYEQSWKKKLSTPTKRTVNKALQLGNEVFINEKKRQLKPENMNLCYQEAARANIINKDRIDSNLDTVLSAIQSQELHGIGMNKSIAKILVSDGSLSMWMQIYDIEQLNYFKKQENRSTQLGVSIAEDSMNTYGIRLIPRIIGLRSDYIPQMIKAKFSAIVKNRDHYSRVGLGRPPLWFINVKIELIDEGSSRKDIRDD